ncbi:hypothetical protein [Microcoleus sp. herbarium14]|uniref:hypothetical protein n=1 Tax=Microcoleus sp. herbarium14 TaxID=3055439 RepID=UPI002FCF95C8
MTVEENRNCPIARLASNTAGGASPSSRSHHVAQWLGTCSPCYGIWGDVTIGL